MSNEKEWWKDGRNWEPGSESQSRRRSHEALQGAANGSHRHRRQRVQQLAGDTVVLELDQTHVRKMVEETGLTSA